MKILLVGEYYSENLGDPLLCQTVEKLIAREYPGAQIIPFDMSGRTGVGKFYQPKTSPFWDAVTKWVCDKFLYYRRAAICRAYDADKERFLRVWYSLKELRRRHKFDLVIFAGGSLFMDYFAGIINLIIRQFALTRTKVIFHACGMSGLGEDGEYLLRQVLCSKKVASISLRDSCERFIRTFPVKCPVEETYDTALNCCRLYDGAARKNGSLGIGLIDRCYELQISLIHQCMAAGIPWRAFTNGSPYDYDYAKKLLTDAGIPAEEMENYLEKRPVTPEELIETVTGFDQIIAFRMHCQIVAASFGVPSFGFAWDAKVAEFYEKLGFPQGCTDREGNLNEIRQILSDYGPDIRSRGLDQGEKSRRCLIVAIDAAMGKSQKE